jgi:glycosyltransferase involved in cell wall biosynthesis
VIIWRILVGVKHLFYKSVKVSETNTAFGKVSSMHILFFAPYFNQPRGNSTTIKRMVHFLQLKNIDTSVFPYMEEGDWVCSDPDFYHILHATRFVQWQKENDFILNRPYLVTMGGTDINVDLQISMDGQMFTFLNNAAFITVFTEDAKDKVIRLFPGWAHKTVVIAQGFWVPWNVSWKKESKLLPRILLPAGLRPVKDVLHILPALDRLIDPYPEMRFSILGAKLDEGVYNQVQKEMNKRNWMSYVGVVPYEVMKVWYAKAQIVINTSLSEGQSLPLMEAMALGLPVIARKNEANLQLIQHKQTGWLYETMEEFQEVVHSIVRNPSLRQKVTQQASEWIAEHSSPEQEVLAYLHLYEQLN